MKSAFLFKHDHSGVRASRGTPQERSDTICPSRVALAPRHALARASRGALPTQRRARLRFIVSSNPSLSSDTKARAAMDGGAPRG
jgi:hypothetical protein